MHGYGTFLHNQGGEFTGIFKNDCFLMNGKFVSPFDGEEKILEFFAKQKEIKILKEKFKNENSFLFMKEGNPGKICEII